MIRTATSDDLAGILAIYNDAVLHSTAIWNETPVDLDNRARWFAERTGRGFPVLVAEDADGKVAGYASFGDFRPFEGYRLTVEHSIYVRSDARGKGIGRALLGTLVMEAERMGKHAIVGGIEAGNLASVRLHEQFGFVRVGLLPQVGLKFGRFLDLLFMQRTFGR